MRQDGHTTSDACAHLSVGSYRTFAESYTQVLQDDRGGFKGDWVDQQAPCRHHSDTGGGCGWCFAFNASTTAPPVILLPGSDNGAYKTGCIPARICGKCHPSFGSQEVFLPHNATILSGGQPRSRSLRCSNRFQKSDCRLTSFGASRSQACQRVAVSTPSIRIILFTTLITVILQTCLHS